MRLALACTLALSLLACAPAPAPSGEVREIRVTTRQFAVDPAEVRVQKGERVRLVIPGLDVTHGFAILEYGINRQILAGESVNVEFVADKPGTFAIYPQTVTVPPGGSATARFTITVPPDLEAGVHHLWVGGRSPGVLASRTLALTVRAGGVLPGLGSLWTAVYIAFVVVPPLVYVILTRRRRRR